MDEILWASEEEAREQFLCDTLPASCENCGRADQPLVPVDVYSGIDEGYVSVLWCGSCRAFELGEDNGYEKTNQGV